MRITAFKYRLRAPGFEVPDTVCLRQQAYDEASAQVLEQMADRVESGSPQVAGGADQERELLKQRLHDAESEASRELPAARAQSFVCLLSEIDTLTNGLATEIATELPGQSEEG
jgi:hypothetical protein